jgi:histone deacetylase complex regulatory component SIN3
MDSKQFERKRFFSKSLVAAIRMKTQRQDHQQHSLRKIIFSPPFLFEKKNIFLTRTGLPDGLISNQKSQFA